MPITPATNDRARSYPGIRFVLRTATVVALLISIAETCFAAAADFATPGASAVPAIPANWPLVLAGLMILALAFFITRLTRRLHAARADVLHVHSAWAKTADELECARAEVGGQAAATRLALHRAGLGSWTWSPGNEAITFDRGSHRLFGFDSAAATTPAALSARVFAADRVRLVMMIHALDAAHNEIETEFPIHWPDGSIRWLALKGSGTHDAAGLLTGATGVILDVTRSRRTAEAIVDANLDLERQVAANTSQLEATNARLRAVLDAATTFAVIATDIRGTITLFNPGAERMLGYPAHEVVGRLSLTDLHAPAELAARRQELKRLTGRECRGFRALAASVGRSGSPEERDWVYVRKDRGHVAVSVTITAVRDARGCANGFLGIARNITERREMVERLRLQSAALEAAHHAVMITDASGAICWVNPAFARLTGYGRDAVIGANPRILSTHLQPPEYFRTMWDTILAGRLWHGEILNRRNDGTMYYEEMTITPVRNERETITHFVAIKQDVTERRHSEMRLREASAAAEQATRAKSEFLAVMSHEIRTPLNGVIGLAQLLRGTSLAPTQMRYAETIQTCADSLLTIINQILDFSKIEAGRLELENTDFDLRAVVEDTLQMVAPRAHAKRLELTADISPEVPRWVRGDPGRLRQVLTNLAHNAAKFTEQGEVEIRVSLARITDHAAEVAFTVRDTGIGIEKDAIQRLFSPFSQADSSTTRRYGGTGLGLAISRQLVELMQGSIHVSSEPGKGSTFQFTVSLGWEPMPATALSTLQLSLIGTRVLVVDDNASQRRVLADLLTAWRMQPAVASDRTAAFRLLRAAADDGQPFAVALIDADMPDAEGIDLAHAINADRTLAVRATIMLSPLNMILEEIALRAARVSGCVTKPVKESRLFDAIATALVGGKSPAESLARSYRNLTPDGAAADGPAPHARPARPLRILLAEDNTINQLVGLDQLGNLGYRADVAADGAEVIDALRRTPYDVILMDCMMPEVDGIQATRRIRELENKSAPGFSGRPPVRIIAMTANAQPGDRDACLAAGMDDYLSKPVRTDDLRRVLERTDRAGLRSATTSVDSPTEPDTFIDHDRLRSITAVSPGKAARLVQAYLDGAEQAKEAIAAALVRRAPQDVRMLAHRWAGSSSTCGLNGVAAALRELEILARSGTLEGAEMVYARIIEAYDRSRPPLLKHLHSLHVPDASVSPRPSSEHPISTIP